MFNAIGRAVVGIISRFNIPTYFIFATVSILCGTFFAILGYTNVYWETQIVIMASGFMLGAHVALNMIVLLKIVGPDLYGLAWGLAATGLGIGFTTSGPIAGKYLFLYIHTTVSVVTNVCPSITFPLYNMNRKRIAR